MLPSLLVSLLYGGADADAFIVTILVVLLTGFLLTRIKRDNRQMYLRDGFAIVALGWLLISFFGAVPFVLSGAIPRPVDAFFESISGFTTTGASILTEVESLPRGILFWRSFTHWIGGMGVLVLTLAILPSVGARTLFILRAESPGPSTEKLVPRIGQTAKILYSIYLAITLVELGLLLACGMPLFDACVHTFGTAGTGGFSSRNLSVGAYQSASIELVIATFMMLFGVNFALYHHLFKREWRTALRDGELRLYLGFIAGSVLLITLNTRGLYQGLGEAVRHAFFQVSSIITTTGYATVNFDLWPTFSKIILVLLMFVGASAGSTGGGIKVVRVLLLFKLLRRELTRILHPRSVHVVRVGNRPVDEETLGNASLFFAAYLTVTAISVLFVSLDGFDVTTTMTAVFATIGNIGPGLGLVGPMGNFSAFSPLSKLVMSFCMLVGRLEVFPLLLVFMPTFWKRVNI